MLPFHRPAGSRPTVLIRTFRVVTWQAAAPRRRALICHRSTPLVQPSILAPDPKVTLSRSTVPESYPYASAKPSAISFEELRMGEPPANFAILHAAKVARQLALYRA